MDSTESSMMSPEQMAELVGLAGQAIASAKLTREAAQRLIQGGKQTKESIADALLVDEIDSSVSVTEAAERLAFERGFQIPLMSSAALEQLGKFQLRYEAGIRRLRGFIYYSWELYVHGSDRPAAEFNTMRGYGEALHKAVELVQLEAYNRCQTEYDIVFQNFPWNHDHKVEVGYKLPHQPNPVKCIDVRRVHSSYTRTAHD